MNENYSPSMPKSVATKQYVDARFPVGATAGGDINDDGTAQAISPNWTVTKGSTGNYTLSTTEEGYWVVICQVYGSNLANFTRKVSVTPSGGSWIIITQSDAVTLEDFRWFFSAVKIEN
jgi:hypothetical protein